MEPVRSGPLGFSGRSSGVSVFWTSGEVVSNPADQQGLMTSGSKHRAATDETQETTDHGSHMRDHRRKIIGEMRAERCERCEVRDARCKKRDEEVDMRQSVEVVGWTTASLAGETR